jgi:hypothetical protein
VAPEPEAAPRDPLALRALPWFACALAVAPLAWGGFPEGHDWLFELVRVAEFGAAFAAGQLVPYWSENLYGGYGSPVFLFYAPLFSALASLASAALGSVPAGATLVLVAASAFSVFAMQAFLADLLAGQGVADAAAARVGATFFVLHPYVLGDKLVRNADAELLALCLAPLALRGVVLASVRPRAAFALVSGGLALVVLAHNLTALVTVAFVLAGGLALFGLRAPRAWGVILAGVAAGLALSAFFWLPALAYTGLIRPEELLRGKLDFRGQFPPLEKIFWYVRFFATGLATPLALCAGAFAAVRFPAQRRALAALLVAAAGLLFLQTRASRPIWEIVPGLPLFQFPWRMMGPLAWVASAVAALVFALALRAAARLRRTTVELAAFALLALNALPILLQYAPLSAEVARMAPALLSPEVVRRAGPSVTLGDEYLPRAADTEVWLAERPIEGPVVAASAPASWKTRANRGSALELVTDAAAPTKLRLARFAWPGWRAQIDGRAQEPVATRRGALEVEVPAGHAEVRVWLEPPPLRRAALWLSLFALAGWLALFAFGRRLFGARA